MHEILPLGGLLLILNIREVTSSHVLPTVAPSYLTSSLEASSPAVTLVPDGVVVSLYYETYRMNYTVDLAHVESARFLQHHQRVCADVSLVPPRLDRWFGGGDSQFYLTYHGCRLTFFTSRPEGVAFAVTLHMPMVPSLGRHVQAWLELKAPRSPVYPMERSGAVVPGAVCLVQAAVRQAQSKHLLETVDHTFPSSTASQATETVSPCRQVGDLLLIIDRSRVTVTSTVLPAISSTPFTLSSGWSSGASLTISPTPEPSPTSSLWPSSSAPSILFDTKSSEPTDQSYPPKVTFTFEWEVPKSLEREIPGYATTVLMEKPDRVEVDGYKTLRVGTLYLIVDTLEVVDTNQLGSTSTLPYFSLRSTYTSTVPLTLTPSLTTPATPATTAPSISTETSTTTTATTPKTSTTITTTSPPTTTSTTTSTTATTTTQSTTRTSFFLSMSFEVMNLTWHQELNDSTSAEFRQHEEQFCQKWRPLRMNFSLQFRTLEGHDPVRMKRLVLSNIKEHARRTTFQDLVVLQMGDLLLSMDSITSTSTTIPTSHRRATMVRPSYSIAYEYVYGLYPGNFSAALLDHNSQEFRVAAWEFCGGISSIFRNLGIRDIRERYQGCYVNAFGDGVETTVNFTIVFNETTVIEKERLYSIIFYSQLMEGMDYLPIGSLWVTASQSARYYLLMLQQFTTHPYPYITTTPPSVFTYVEIKFQVQAPEWTSDLADSSSARFQTLAQSFCRDASTAIFIDRLMYGRYLTQQYFLLTADVVATRQRRRTSDQQDHTDNHLLPPRFVDDRRNPMLIVADLTFRGEQPASLDSDVDTILFEMPDWVIVQNESAAIKIGDLYIHADSSSTASAQRRQAANPCLLGGDTYRHPALCDRFLQCVGDQPFEIECGPGSIYTDGTCKTPLPGFLCTSAPTLLSM
ncbi:hypothetical protein C0Q70_21241 [Pomacea canaliculata]|uniref:Chitin-binding type-2 domain-containing protein n=1 Tax=Pomacea canaliculata TaxID=400727 RepID=A0A2T7NC01_POMCA|nr:hypothetical protein C0Q70_21241 [Pomacea canaliculata]